MNMVRNKINLTGVRAPFDVIFLCGFIEVFGRPIFTRELVKRPRLCVTRLSFLEGPHLAVV